MSVLPLPVGSFVFIGMFCTLCNVSVFIDAWLQRTKAHVHDILMVWSVYHRYLDCFAMH